MFFTVFERYPDEPRVAFFITKITVTSDPNDSNVLSGYDPNIGQRNYDLFTYLYIK